MALGVPLGLHHRTRNEGRADLMHREDVTRSLREALGALTMVEPLDKADAVLLDMFQDRIKSLGLDWLSYASGPDREG